jgi:hypothetical protein
MNKVRLLDLYVRDRARKRCFHISTQERQHYQKGNSANNAGHDPYPILSLARHSTLPTGLIHPTIAMEYDWNARAQSLAMLRHRAPALARRGTGGAAAGIPKLVPADRVRAVRAREVHGRDACALAGRGDRIIGEIIERMRRDGCGGQAGLVELITSIPGASRPVRRIILQDCPK